MPAPVFDALRPASGPVRAARSVAVALVCTATAAFGHVLAGGTILAVSAAAVFGGATAVAWLLSSRRVTLGQMVGLLVLCQVVVHAGGSMDAMQMSFAMLAAHVVATVVSATALARGEAFVWALAERLGLRRLPHHPQILVVLFGAVLVPDVEERSLQDVRLAHSRTERGPPSGSR